MTKINDYQEFVKGKAIRAIPTGISVLPENLNPMLYDFQRDMVRWALKKGRACLFCDCGLGKTPMQLAWADQVPGRVLILAPLAVAQQTCREGQKFGIDVTYARHSVDERITITNYEMLEHFNPADYTGIILDESSILKSYDGKFRNQIIDSFKSTPFKLACTATPAPNDHMELGNHAEFMGVLSRTEMLSTFFVHDGGDTSQWRLKGHAAKDFWQWVCSWAVMIRKPSDLGYDDGAFVLPPLEMHQHIVEALSTPEGALFALEATTLQERQQARKGTTQERCQAVADIVLTSNGNCDELAACGNQNIKKTGSDACGKIQNTGIESRPSDQEPLKKTQYICGSIERLTEPSGIAPENNRTQSTQGDANYMRPMNPSGLKQDQKFEIGKTPIQGSGLTSESKSMDLPQTHMTNYSDLRAGSAQSAEPMTQGTEGEGDSTSTTVTQPGKSEDCSAQTVISALENSETTKRPLPPQWLIWCNLNNEADTVEKMIPGSVQVAGSDSNDAKVQAVLDFQSGKIRVLISKPSIFGYGLNLQSCHHVAFLGLSDSYEQFYQAVRRTYRFGQKRTVNCHIVTSDIEGAVVANIQRKEADAARMAMEMVSHMHSMNEADIRGSVRTDDAYVPQIDMVLPSWMVAA